MITTFAVVAEGELVSIFVRGQLVLQKWRAAGTGGGKTSWYGPGESIHTLPDRRLYVTGDFPDGWSHRVRDGYQPLGWRARRD